MAEQRWSDPHLWVALIAPIGAAITICATISFAFFPIYYDLTNRDSVAGKIATTAIFVVLFMA
jgi:hypothetical protein